MYRICIAAICCTAIASTCGAKDWYVHPDGKATNAGTESKPLDFNTALSDADRIKPGDMVYLMGGTYMGPFEKPRQPAGAPNRPIVYRALPEQRVTITASEDTATALTIKSSHTWFWGMELTIGGKMPEKRSDVVKIAGGDGVKLINMVIHNSPNRSGIGAWDVGNDHEIYGCLIYRNGIDPGNWAHGIYTQNRENHTTKVIADCLIFNNFGWGMHCYGEAPKLANYLFEGCVLYGNGMPEGSAGPVANFLCGGKKDSNNVVMRECYTYFPPTGRFKRGADFGYIARNNGSVTIDRCMFIGGLNALELKAWHQVTFNNNVCYTPSGIGLVMTPPAGNNPFVAEVARDELFPETAQKQDRSYNRANSTFTGNTYHFEPGKPAIHRSGIAYTSIDQWRNDTGWDKDSRMISGKPDQLHVALRPNKYEPAKAHLIVYNWPGDQTVSIDLKKRWPLKRGTTVKFYNVEDVFGEPTLVTTYDGNPINLPVAGTFAPQFACYLITTH